MARYYKLIVYTTGDEYETRETLIDEIAFRQIQRSIANGSDFIIFEDRVIKRNMIKEITSADDEVREFAKMGLSPARLGIPERKALPEGEREEQLSGGWKKLMS